MRFCLLLACLALSACVSSRSEAPARLVEGTWTGAITPMNHPDQSAPISYQVAYANEALMISVVGSEEQMLPTRGVALSDNGLAFVFDEPEANVPLRCDLARQPDGSFEGRCSDAEGKWARFTMTPPVE